MAIAGGLAVIVSAGAGLFTLFHRFHANQLVALKARVAELEPRNAELAPDDRAAGAAGRAGLASP